MTTISLIDANTGRFLDVDLDSISGSIYVIDEETGEFKLLNLASPNITLSVIDAKTGEFVSIDYLNPTGLLNVIDANTGEFVEIDLSNPSFSLYVNDADTGELVLLTSGTSDNVAPTVAIYMSDYSIGNGDTATVTFIFSEEPSGFTVANVTAPNGSLSSFAQSGDVKVYTATFTPTNGVQDATNVITVDTAWTDVAGNPPASSTTSSNYTVDTAKPTVTITCSQSSPSSASTLNFTITFSESVTGFDVSEFVVTNGTKGALGGSGAVYTCDVTPTGMSVVTANVAADVAIDAAGNTNTAAAQLSITSTAPFSDAFTRADGGIAGIWTGATWTIASNAALNTPTLGAEQLVNPGFEGTYENEGGTLNLAPNWNQLSCEAGDVLDESADAHSGSKSQIINVNAANEGIISTGTIPANKWVQLSAWMKKTAGQIYLMDAAGVTFVYYIDGNASWTQYLITGKFGATPRAIQFMSAGGAANYNVDDASIKEIGLSSMFATLPDLGVASVTAQVVIPSDPLRTQAGLVINLDSASNPQNFVIAIIDGTAAAQRIKLIKCVSGTYTDVIDEAVTFGVTKNLKVIKSGDTYSLWYGTPGAETQVGTNQTITGMNGTIHGLFSSHPTAKFDNYQLTATP